MTTAHIELHRTIHTSPERVFEAWTKPEWIMRWLSPGDSAVLDSSVDLRIGGSYRIRMKGEMNGKAFDVVVGGIYQDIVTNELLRFTWVYEDEERRKSVGNSVVTVRLRRMDAGTELTLIHEKLATPEAQAGHHWGWTNCLAKLAASFGGNR